MRICQGRFSNYLLFKYYWTILDILGQLDKNCKAVMYLLAPLHVVVMG